MFVHLSNFGEINAYLEPQMPWWLCNEAGCCCLEYYVTLCPGLPSPLLPRWRTKPNKRISNLFRISELWRSMLAKNPNSGILGQLCRRFLWLQHLNRMTQEFIVWVSRHLTWKICNDQRCCTSDLSASSRDSNTRDRGTLPGTALRLAWRLWRVPSMVRKYSLYPPREPHTWIKFLFWLLIRTSRLVHIISFEENRNNCWKYFVKLVFKVISSNGKWTNMFLAPGLVGIALWEILAGVWKSLMAI